MCRSTPRGCPLSQPPAALELGPSYPAPSAALPRYAVDACTASGYGDAADTVSLLVSEVATHAVKHSYGTHVRVRVPGHGLRLRVAVPDGSPALPVPREARAMSTGEGSHSSMCWQSRGA